MCRRPLAVLMAIASLASSSPAQERPATVREFVREFPTYPFGDPDPIPNVGRIYPYFRFDGFSTIAQPKKWKVIELENDYIKVIILPEIGGKIWAAIEKRSGRPYIYFNHVVKFRDIAMRGPWTSGGIEANYGIIGHTPNVSTPVDYAVRRNGDGSVSAITGALDLLTNTTWRLETRLAPDQAYFTTSSTWNNGSGVEQPYYTWMTAGIPTEGDLRYVFPGTGWIGHDGEPGEWPTNSARGRDVSSYEANNFGPYKSYHVMGSAGDFFGAYWNDQNFGMARVAPRDEKPGQKIWIWGLSRQGMIWEDLLTDTDGQYSELQSGRLFNQSAEGSTFTPFKHRGFTPHLTDRWTERWMPVVGTKGFVVASAAGALNVTADGDRLIVALSPAERIADSLVVTVQGKVVRARQVVRAPLQLWADTITVAGLQLRDVKVVLGDERLVYVGDPARSTLDRPIATPSTFNWSTAFGVHLLGKELMRQREYDRAVVLLDSALALSPHYVPALVDRAILALRAMEDERARLLTRTALAVDSYDGAANYYYGLANRRLNRLADARDGFEIATQSVEYRLAAYVELAKLSLAEENERLAESYALKALAMEPQDVGALGVSVVVARRRDDALVLAARLLALRAADPLSLHAAYERRSFASTARRPPALIESIRAELPEQRMLDLSAWLMDVGERRAALEVLEGIGEQPEALYWRATLDTANAATLVRRANALSPRFVLPFRREVIAALRTAATITPEAWQPVYYRALGEWHLGHITSAAQLLDGLDTTPTFAPVYAARAALPGRPNEQQIVDLERAARLEPTEWRYGKRLVERLLAVNAPTRAESVALDYARRFPASYILGVTLVRAQMANAHYADAERLLDTITIIPFEGSAEGHALYRETKLMRAIDAMKRGDAADARTRIAAAREWPERLGAGKPYAENLDERLEDWLGAEIDRRTGVNLPRAEETLARLGSWMAQVGTSSAPATAELRVIQAWRALPPR
jgi:tetratricopeptide (TPR) repeat protein